MKEIMTAILGGILVISMFIAVPLITKAHAELKYNAMEGRWEYAPRDSNIRYNSMEGKWSYQRDDDELKYNAMEGRWEWDEVDRNNW